MLRILGAFAAACALVLLIAKSCESDPMPAVASQRHVIDNVAWRDTLFLSASFSECGEWGGHRELIKIYLRAAKRPKAGPEWTKWRKGPLTAAFWLDTIGCSKPNRKFFLTGQRLLGPVEEAAVTHYLQQLQQHSLHEVYPAQTGQLYRVWTADEELRVRFYDTREGWQGFAKLRGQLFHK